ncbi:putative holin-like toxin [Phascolarctobacterium succinatutens]|uniref:putative holin-like toxin n=1 Tax=Phascolarctobacterium succinatutens TaxID=626940 RepID=UPI003AF1D8E0
MFDDSMIKYYARRPCCRVALPKFLGMEVMSMVYFSFQDLMSFGIFIVALLTFIFQNRK